MEGVSTMVRPWVCWECLTDKRYKFGLCGRTFGESAPRQVEPCIRKALWAFYADHDGEGRSRPSATTDHESYSTSPLVCVCMSEKTFTGGGGVRHSMWTAPSCARHRSKITSINGGLQQVSMSKRASRLMFPHIVVCHEPREKIYGCA